MEKILSIRPYTVIGSSGETGIFSRIFAYQPAEEEIKQSRGEIYAVFSCVSPGLNADWERVAINSFNRLRDVYHQSLEGNPLQAMEDALTAAHDVFQQGLLAVHKENESIDAQIYIGGLAIWGGGFLFHSLGDVYFALIRNNELIDMSHDHFAQEILQSGDSLVLGTPLFGERLGHGVLQKILQSELSDNWQSLLKQESGEDALSQLSGVILNVSVEGLPDKDDVIELVMPNMPAKKQSKGIKFSFPQLKPFISQFSFNWEPVTRIVAKITDRLKHPQVYLRTPKASPSVKKWLLVGFVTTFLGASVFATYRFNQKNESKEQQEVLHTEVQQQLENVKELAKVDPVQAKRALETIQDSLGQVQGAEIQRGITEAFDIIYKIQYLTPQTVTVPFSVESSIFVPYDTSTLAILSSSQGEFGYITSDSGYEQQGAFDALNGGNYLSGSTEGLYAYHPDSGLWYVDGSTHSLVKIIEQAGQWGRVNGIRNYLDNVYILTPEKEQIVKYFGLGEGQLSGSANYFIDPVSLGEVVDFAIDGHIYLLHSDARVEKFLGGRRTDFSLKGVFPSFDHEQKIVTHVDFKHVYILSDNSIHVFSTDGDYVKRLALQDKSIDDFSLTNDEQWLYVRSGGELLKVQLGEE